MADLIFNRPQCDASLPSPTPASEDVKRFLETRRSTPIKAFDSDGTSPDEKTVRNLVDIAMRVPDHRKLGPWRAIIFSGENRRAFGDILAERFKILHPEAGEAALQTERERLLRAPVCVTIVSSPVVDPKGTPIWEQELSAGALCMNLLYAAHAAGYAATWLSEWWAFDEGINDALGLTDKERVAGHIFIGTSKADLFERPRPDFSERISSWSAV